MNSIFSKSWSGPETTARATPPPRASSGGNHAAPDSSSPVDEQPVLGERLAELDNDRPLEQEMRVAHRMRRPVAQQILATDIEPAGEGDASVDDEQLLVGAQIEQRHAPRQRRVQEAGDADAAATQPPVGRRDEIAATDAVDENTHLDAALAGANQRVDEGAAGRIGAEDVARQRDAGARAVDRGEHSWIGLVAVAQERDGIAALGPPPGDALPGLLERRQMVVAARRRGGRLGAVFRLPLAQPAGAPPHPVDAEDQIDDAAENRREPGKADPADRGADVTLVQQHMPGDPDGEHEMHERKSDRIDLLENAQNLSPVSRAVLRS